MSTARCALTILLLSAPVVAWATQAGQADLILVNGHVLTVDPHNSVVQAVAIRAGRILAVGSNRRIRALALLTRWR